MSARFLLLFVALCCNACLLSTAHESDNSNAAIKRETPKVDEQAQENLAQSKSVEKSACEKNVEGLPENVKIPARLCINSSQPVDKSEIVPDPPPGVRQSNSLFDEDVTYNKLPVEVREVIELTVKDRYKDNKFHLTVIPTFNEGNAKRTVKSYRYFPLETDGNFVYWDFKKQGGKLKLDSAELPAALTTRDKTTVVSKSESVQVKFARGSDSAEFKGVVYQDKDNEYLLEAKAGQTMTILMDVDKSSKSPNSDYDVALQIFKPNDSSQYAELENKKWQGRLPESGEYKILVSSMTESNGYKLKISVR